MKNTKGMSEIVVTLILILLAIVVVGVVWVVVSRVVNNGSQQINYNSMCLGSQAEITSAVCTKDGTSCNVTVRRTSGSDPIAGVRVVFDSADGSSQTSDIALVSGNWTTLQSVTKPVTFIPVLTSNVTKVEAAIQFTKTDGSTYTCGQGVTTYDQVRLV